MASRQVVARAVNWAALASRIPKDPKYSAGFDEMRIKFETAKGSLNSTPEKPVPIDWSHYSSVVKNQALVEKLQAAYSELVVPYPDTAEALASLEAEKTEQLSKDGAMKEELGSATAEAQEKIDTLRNRKAYEIMSVDEYFELEPAIAEEFHARAAEAEKYRVPFLGVGTDPKPVPTWTPPE